MKIGIIGSVMHDQIRTVEGKEFESFGGILYNALALGRVIRAADTIMPVTYMGEDHLKTVREEYFSAVPQIDESAIQINPEGTDSNVLEYVTPSSRKEQMTIVSPTYEVELLSRVFDANALLINFINGNELDLETFKTIREKHQGLIYLDIHNLGKIRKDGVPVKGHRFDRWKEWVSCVDIVQGNEWEAERLLDLHPKTEEEFRAAALALLDVEGPRIATLTLGGEGCAIAWKERDDSVRFARIPAMEDVKIVDTTGCGDSFSAGYLVEFLRTGDPLKSAVFAATVSGLNCERTGLQGLTELSGTKERMHQGYADLLEKIDQGWRGEAV